VAVLVAVATISATAGSAAGLPSSQTEGAWSEALHGRARQPGPLQGLPLRGKTSLRLLVADNPPFVLDIDTGTVTAVPGIRAITRGTLGVVGVGGRAAVVIVRSVWLRASIYAVSGPDLRVSYLGAGWNATSAVDGRSVWVQSFVDPSRCELRQVGLDGRELRAGRPFPCAASSDPPGSAVGLVVGRTRVLDPLTSRTVLRTPWAVIAAAGTRLVLAGPGNRFTLLDTTTRAQRRLSWPSILDELDQPAVDSTGRFVALAFADPAWRGGQALDAWLLDTATGELTQLPGMPALVSLKRTSVAWTDDARLVLLAEIEGKGIVAVWEPGRRSLALKTVRLPERSGGSDSFAPVRSG
jgi:hypothetical protein